jgi:hypothetical protein
MKTWQVYIQIGRTVIISMMYARTLEALRDHVEHEYPMGTITEAHTI